MLLAPRVLLLLLFFFSTYLNNIWPNIIWPVLGFIFLPVTTLAYAYAQHNGGTGDGFNLGLIIVGVVIDLGLHGGSGWRARRRRGE